MQFQAVENKVALYKDIETILVSSTQNNPFQG